MFALRSRVTIPMAALLFVVACSDSSGPEEQPPPQNQNTMTATINGNGWTGTTVLAVRSGNSVSISGRDAQDREIVISISGVTAGGGFAIGPGAPATVQYRVGDQTWVGHLNGATGSVNIGTLTSTHMIGTFTLLLMPQANGATGTMTISGNFTAYFGQT